VNAVALWPDSQWNGEYVGVYEPPQVEGRVVAPKPVYGPRIIRNLDLLREMAISHVDQLQLAERPGMRLFTEFSPLQPIRARVSRTGGRSYYIVPFAESPKKVQAAIILNAYTGVYEESILLPKDCFLQFLTKAEAFEMAVKHYGVKPEWLTSPRLIHTPSVETPNRFFPVWHVSLRRDVFVTPRAEAVHRLAATEEEFWNRFERKG
jgi:hypothetical protein